ncbi:MAG: HAMP domain-containing protein [Anaerolineae bacterium]|nr:HAMP domain-containing protein [Anaerolineae bacterium]MCB9105011.1 HAMP domain-containing protein [Anaerolineales bacterium]
MTSINQADPNLPSISPTNNAFTLKRRHSLRWRLLTLLGAILLVTLLVIGVGVYYFILNTEQRTWRQRQDEAARYAAEVVSTFMERTVSSLNAVGLLDADLLAVQPTLLDQLLAQNPALLEIVRLDQRGQVISGAYQEAPIIANQFTIPQSVWFLESQKGQLYLGSVQISATSQPYLIMATPAVDGGVVAARLRMNVLWDVVADLHFGETGQAYIVNPDGHVVAHTDPEVALARTDLSDRPEMQGILQAATGPGSDTYLNFENIEVVGVNRPVVDTPWVIVTEVPTAEVFATSRTALLLLGGGLAAFGLVVMLVTGRFLGQLILRPMDQLRTGAVRIGRGEFSYQIGLAGQNEVGQVAHAFNDMVKQLHDREETLKQQREFLQQVIDINPHFIFAKDTAGRYILANKAFTDAYKTSLDNLLGKTDKDFKLSPELMNKYRREEKQVLETGQELRIEEEQITNLAGQTVWRKTIKRPILNKAGVPHQILGVATDITDRKWAEEALALARDQALEASRLKTQLLANVSHDLRTPLGGILGFAEMLQAGVFGELTREQNEAVNEIIDSTNQLLSFVNNLLNQARIETGAVALKLVPFSPATLVTDIKSMFGPLAQYNELALIGQVSPETPEMLMGDIDWLRQMVANLVGNAIKFTETGEIRIRIFCPNPEQWAIQVADTGPGIPTEAQEYIFEAFRQVDGTITREHGGSGLGLSIVKQLTIIMGGSITLTSDIGKGSTFTIFLPLETVQEQLNGKQHTH